MFSHIIFCWDVQLGLENIKNVLFDFPEKTFLI